MSGHHVASAAFGLHYLLLFCRGPSAAPTACYLRSRSDQASRAVLSHSGDARLVRGLLRAIMSHSHKDMGLSAHGSFLSFPFAGRGSTLDPVTWGADRATCFGTKAFLFVHSVLQNTPSMMPV